MDLLSIVAAPKLTREVKDDRFLADAKLQRSVLAHFQIKGCWALPSGSGSQRKLAAYR
jgi:hypothetical protein